MLPTILYVDDEEINLFLFKSVFQSTFNVLTSPSPLKALEIVGKEDLDAAIVDMKMPDMNGVDFIKQARLMNSKIPYFILSGYHQNDERNEAFSKKEISHIFTKPFHKKEVTDVIMDSI